MTDTERKIDDMRRLIRLTSTNAEAEKKTAQVAARINAATEVAERKKAIAEEIKNLAKQTADLEFEAATVGLSAAQKRVELMKKMHATEDQIAQAQKHATAIDRAEALKKSVDVVRGLLTGGASPFEKFQESMEHISRVLADPKSGLSIVDAMKAADNAAKSLGPRFENPAAASNPAAVIRGTAAAELAAANQKNPVSRFSAADEAKINLAKKNLAAQEKIRAAVEANKPVPDLVASFS